ncbi:AEC family transporter [Tropicimonas marinistellae]|uniref:AEC family transporter n=1 Tax=Tropicimonas marinistellae TaxID=1739787 RepID=UPI00082BB318|nr:AEC family transporter [Tropicimonas marinistellae]
MFAPLASLLPIYLLILLGYLSIRSRLFSADALPHISRFTLYICIPVLVASAVSRVGSPKDFNWQFIAGYGLASFAVIFLGALAMRRFFGFGPGRSWVIALGMGNSNSLFLGLPIALILIPDRVDMLVAWVVMTENVLTIPLAATMADVVAQTHPMSFREAVGDTLRRMVRSPVLIGLAVGLLCAASGLGLPAPFEKTRGLIVAAAPVLALFVVGGNMALSRVTEVGGPVLTVVIAKLLIHPAAVFGTLLVLPGVPTDLAIGGLIFACVPMLAIYPIFAARHGAERVASSAMGAATLAGAVTVGAIVVLLH